MGLKISTSGGLRGRTRNPWHPDHTAGGSSGGEASAIASGMSPLGLLAGQHVRSPNSVTVPLVGPPVPKTAALVTSLPGTPVHSSVVEGVRQAGDALAAAGGLPRGVQIYADRFRDDLTLDAAQVIEAAVGRITPFDPIT